MTHHACPRPPNAPMISVYDGQTCIGFVLNRGKSGYEAVDVDDVSHGFFATQREAAAALVRS